MKFAILGAGNIAQTMANTISKMNGIESYAVASRDIGKATEFATKNGFEKAYGSYEELVQDDEVELVYIATPHSHHYAHARLCIEHGKPVLCEKAFTANAKQAKEILSLAKEKKVFITEAIWTRYMPSRERIQAVIESGIIGDVTSVTANLGYAIGQVERLVKPELAGGALLDLGVYPINFACMVLGSNYSEVSSTAIITDTGVDSMNTITLSYADGKMASLHSTFMARTNRMGIISGTQGYMEIQNINNCEEIRVYNSNDELLKKETFKDQITGYEYQVEACVEAMKNGLLECLQMPHAETIKVMELMDSLRKEWGVIYPWDETDN
ncbi:MAG TPA: gfo/Idh/MocA family oxidoreductase [Lachnospiraceae bacterium]|uniref:Gfo/Idh/MocA family protein n=1 Tax=Anaerosporobacter sp. TaxID=1872529 RepID=UPI000EE154C9|nr:Gfo/Idh/MocA family oxidoreductase [Anaerosporobacter sp.]HAB60602.1 gfo/Idh/MocA family oxidoreductase [Lachnospiraceae bacterium]